MDRTSLELDAAMNPFEKLRSLQRWYCSFCKRDVSLPAPSNRLVTVTQCPVCKNNSCVWLEYTPRQRKAPVLAGEPFLKKQSTP